MKNVIGLMILIFTCQQAYSITPDERNLGIKWSQCAGWYYAMAEGTNDVAYKKKAVTADAKAQQLIGAESNQWINDAYRNNKGQAQSAFGQGIMIDLIKGNCNMR